MTIFNSRKEEEKKNKKQADKLLSPLTLNIKSH